VLKDGFTVNLCVGRPDAAHATASFGAKEGRGKMLRAMTEGEGKLQSLGQTTLDG
jgi:hypothetical protein